MDNLNIIAKAPLFDGIDKKDIKSFLERAQARRYIKGEIIFSMTQFSHSVGIVAKGAVRVTRDTGERAYIVNTICAGGMFGVSSVFSQRPRYSTAITADSDCEILFFDRASVLYMFEKNIKVTENYISFLTDRILFLNDKIRALTADSALSRLAEYLLCEQSQGICEVASYSLLARKLDIGRASLYRAIDMLCSAGTIVRNGKNIVIKDEDKLKDF